MSSRIWSRCSAFTLTYLKNIRTKVNLPNEFGRRPAYVPPAAYILLSIPAAFAAGTIYYEASWYDVNRRMKDEAYESIKPLVDLPAHDLRQIFGMNFRHVRIRGHFDYDNEVYILNQRKRTGIESMKRRSFLRLIPFQNMHTHDDMRLHKTPNGHWVITPFILSDGKKILVNRGWVPVDRKDPSKRASGQVKGELELTGYVRTLNQKHGLLSDLRSDPESGNYRYRNIDKIAGNLKTLPIWVDLDRESSDRFPGGPIGGQTSLEYFNDEEFESWWCLIAAVSTFGMWYFKFVGPLKFRYQQ